MNEQVQGYVTAGIALLGAGVIAATPVAPPPEVVRASDHAVSLMASPIEILAGGIGQSAVNLAEIIVLTPADLSPITEAIAAADQTTQRELYGAIRNYIDGPLFVIDPTLAAINSVVPPPVGGGTGDFQQTSDSAIKAFRMQYLSGTAKAARDIFADALAVDDAGVPIPGASPSALVTLALGVGASALRLNQSVAESQLIPVAIAADIVAGTAVNQAVYNAVRKVVDAPLHIADPTIDALAKVLPAPVGGTDGDPTQDLPNATGTDGDLIHFRDNVLSKATSDIRTPIRDALGAHDPVSSSSSSDLLRAQGGNEVGASALDKVAVPKAGKKSTVDSPVKKIDQHRKQSDNPVAAAIKKIRESLQAKDQAKDTTDAKDKDAKAPTT
jgi:hypothetical protein